MGRESDFVEIKLFNLFHRIATNFEPLYLPFSMVAWFDHTKSSCLNTPRGVSQYAASVTEPYMLDFIHLDLDG